MQPPNLAVRRYTIRRLSLAVQPVGFYLTCVTHIRPFELLIAAVTSLTFMALILTQEKGLIFRITHRDNVPWILDNGMHARNGKIFDPNCRNIGNVDLIDKRSRRTVAVAPGGTLSDYVPFYFTPYSIMMYNIRTGYGVKQVPNHEIVIFVSSLPHVESQGRPVCLHKPACLSTDGRVFYGPRPT